jgi:four helix bundle protein
MGKKFHFENLNVYQESIKLSEKCYEIIKKFPNEEQYGLISQFTRCSSSIALNIAEGYGRFYKRNKNQFYHYAKASVYECIPILTIALKRNYINEKEYNEIYNKCFNISMMIAGLIKSVNKREL